MRSAAPKWVSRRAFARAHALLACAAMSIFATGWRFFSIYLKNRDIPEKKTQTFWFKYEASQLLARRLPVFARLFRRNDSDAMLAASAVTEQSAVTSNISQNMQTASAGVETITNDIQAISSAATQIEGTASKVQEASRQVA
ncbi:hypothetical protein ACKTEK_14425 [Tepidamorphus sp. 3E244]|uniref:hypothetical protein n=1 Tax=Tepidamorphus sp. 3E244 TaxID=3385498 RepID=UPI0038FC0F14